MIHESSKRERTEWRDIDLSLRHRLWGMNCPAVDLDFLLIEYDEAKAKAMVEYKHELASIGDAKRPNYLALRDVADRANLPLLAVRYAESLEWFRVTPLNLPARFFCPHQTTFDEVAYVRLLYRMRGREMPKQIEEAILETKKTQTP